MRAYGSLLGVFCALCLGASCAFAQGAEETLQVEPYNKHHDRHMGHDHVYPDRGAIFHDAPKGAIVVNYAGLPYRFYNGVWFEPRGPVFIVVEPPIGLVVPQLPAFATAFQSGAQSYFYANDVYYLARPELAGYEVVNDPADSAAPAKSAPASAPALKGATLAVADDEAPIVTAAPTVAAMPAATTAPGSATGSGVASAPGTAATPAVAKEQSEPATSGAATTPGVANAPSTTAAPGVIAVAGLATGAALATGPSVAAAPSVILAPGAAAAPAAATAAPGALRTASVATDKSLGAVGPPAPTLSSASIGPPAPAAPIAAPATASNLSYAPATAPAWPTTPPPTAPNWPTTPPSTGVSGNSSAPGPGIAPPATSTATAPTATTASEAGTTAAPQSAPQLAGAAVSAAAPAAPTHSGRTTAYPRNGQSSDQQARDHYECYQFGVAQSGYDPMRSSGAASNGLAEFQRAQSACFQARGYSLQ